MLMTMVAASTLSAAISEKYNQGYDLKSLPLNTAKNESNISLFADNQMLFLQNGKVYLASFTANQDSLVKPVRSKELTNLGIKGNVPYD